MIERLFAAIALAVCAVLLVRLVIGERRRWRFDAYVRRMAQGVRRFGLWAWHWRNARRATKFYRLPPDRVCELGSEIEL